MLMLNQETVNLLKQTSSDLENTTDGVTKAGDLLKSSYEENKAALGPHVDQINSILENLEKTRNESNKIVIFVGERLNAMSSKYQDVISKNLSSASNS